MTPGMVRCFKIGSSQAACSRKTRSTTKVCVIPRSREVGQSYFTSIWTTLVALWCAFSIVYREAPQLVRFCSRHKMPWHALKEWKIPWKSHAGVLECPFSVAAGAGEWAWHMHTHLFGCLLLQVCFTSPFDRCNRHYNLVIGLLLQSSI